MQEELIRYGLSEKEAKLYILLLKVDETTANKLISLSNYPRATVYDTLKKLSLKSLITNYIKNKTTYFKANNPDILLKTLDEKRIEVERFLPKLKMIINSSLDSVSVEIFKGLFGVRAILDEIISSTKEVFVMGNEEDARKVILHHPENFRQKRIENKIKIKNLLEGSKTAKTLENDSLSEVRHLSSLKKYTDVIMIYNNVVVRIIKGEETTIIKTISKEHANNERIIFKELWDRAK